MLCKYFSLNFWLDELLPYPCLELCKDNDGDKWEYLDIYVNVEVRIPAKIQEEKEPVIYASTCIIWDRMQPWKDRSVDVLAVEEKFVRHVSGPSVILSRILTDFSAKNQ